MISLMWPRDSLTSPPRAQETRRSRSGAAMHWMRSVRAYSPNRSGRRCMPRPWIRYHRRVARWFSQRFREGDGKECVWLACI